MSAEARGLRQRLVLPPADPLQRMVGPNGEQLVPAEKRLVPGKVKFPDRIAIVLWDIDGTITDRDVPDEVIVRRIIETAASGTIHAFITGRDAQWMKRVLHPSMEESAKATGVQSQAAFSNVRYGAEVGLVYLDPVSLEPTYTTGSGSSDRLAHHPISDRDTWKTIKNFFLRAELLTPEDQECPSSVDDYVIGRDADKRGYWFPLERRGLPEGARETPFWQLMASETKKRMRTIEVVRDSLSHLRADRAATIAPAAESLSGFFKSEGLEDYMQNSPVSTAINIVPILNRIVLDKDWAAGHVLLAVQAMLREKDKTEVSLEELAAHTIGIGDGAADFKFARPLIERVDGGRDYLDVPFAYVGPKAQRDEGNKNLAMYAEGYQGAEATRDVISGLNFVSVRHL
jgi:hypothetical protein